MSMFRVIAAVLAFLNLGGIVSSGIIMWYLYCLVAKDDYMLFNVITWPGGANTLVLIAPFFIWWWVWWKKTYEYSFPGA